MNLSLEEYSAADKDVPMREVVANLQQTLERNHQKILAAALSDWERRNAGRDPTDACVSVHVAPTAPRTRKAKPSYQKLVRRGRNNRTRRGSGSRDN